MVGYVTCNELTPRRKPGVMVVYTPDDFQPSYSKQAPKYTILLKSTA